MHMIVVPINLLVFIFIVWAVTWPAVLSVIRRRRAASVLEHLDHAVRLDLPLAEAMRAAVPFQPNGLQVRLCALVVELEYGTGLAEALRRAVPELGSRALGMLTTAERLGRLPATLRRLTRPRRVADQNAKTEMQFARTYGFTLLLLIVALFGGLFFFILPAFWKIFEDFGTKLPRSTTILYELHDGYAGLVVVLLSMLAVVVLTFYIIKLLPWQPRVQWLRDLIGWSVWPVPGLRQAMRDRALADVFFTLREATAAGAALHQAVGEAALLPIHPAMRRRVKRWAALLMNGHAAGASAERVGLPSMAYGTIATAERTGDLSGALAFLQHHYDSRFHRFEQFLRAALGPMMVIVLGGLVGLVVYALFAPIPALVQSVADTTGLGGGL